MIGENTTLDLSNFPWSYKVGIHHNTLLHSYASLASTNYEHYNQIGLDGEVRRIHLDRRAVKWHSGMFPTNRPFTWYKVLSLHFASVIYLTVIRDDREVTFLLYVRLKATFQAPLGSEAVVVDLLGMGKGTAWVNGNSIGRFWPNYTASADGCHECDYRGTFSSNKCQTGCGEPSQRW